jgi:hypothetical protein
VNAEVDADQLCGPHTDHEMGLIPDLAEQAERFELEEGATSLKLLQKVYRSPAIALTTRIRAAMAALQFEHPKLAVTATVQAGDFADQLERAIERSRRVMIEAKPMIEANVSSTNVPSEASDTKRPLSNGKPMIPDRRYRRW